MVITQADHTKWKPLGALGDFFSFTLPENYKEVFPEYTFHYECVEGDLDECDYTYVEVNGHPVILQKYLNLETDWCAMFDVRKQTPELNKELREEIIKAFSIQNVTWVREEF